MEHFCGGHFSPMPIALSSSSSCSPSCSPSSSPSAPSPVLSEGPISFLHSYWMSLSRLSLRALLRSGSSWLLTVVSSDRVALSRSFFLLRVHHTQTTMQKIQRTLKTTHSTGTRYPAGGRGGGHLSSPTAIRLNLVDKWSMLSSYQQAATPPASPLWPPPRPAWRCCCGVWTASWWWRWPPSGSVLDRCPSTVRPARRTETETQRGVSWFVSNLEF